MERLIRDWMRIAGRASKAQRARGDDVGSTGSEVEYVEEARVEMRKGMEERREEITYAKEETVARKGRTGEVVVERRRMGIRGREGERERRSGERVEVGIAGGWDPRVSDESGDGGRGEIERVRPQGAPYVELIGSMIRTNGVSS